MPRPIRPLAHAVLLAAIAGGAQAADHHTDVPLGGVLPGANVSATATPPGTPLTGDITSAGGWPWIKLSLVSYSATVPSSFSGTHTSTFAGTYTLGGTGPGRVLTWDMTATANSGKWLAGRAIEGVGEVSKTSPTGPSSNNLHYAGTGTPETAAFKIDVSKAKDYDKHSLTGEERDAGLDEYATEWKVPEGTGTITQGGYTAIFTPSSEVRTNITVDAIIHEGKQLSYADGNYDSPVTKRWSETLTTFKVGVVVNPGNRRIYEDDSSSALSVLLGSVALEGRTGWTGVWAKPGKVTAGGTMPLKSVSWRAVAETASGQVSGTMKSIKYAPSIIVEGQARMFLVIAGLLPPGSNGDGVLIKWLAKSSSYVEAGLDIITLASGSMQVYCLVAGNSVIENEGTREVGEQVSIDDSGPKVANLAGLSIAGKQVTAGPGDTIQGSVTMKSEATVNDNSRICEGTAIVQRATATASAKSTRPSYGN